MKLLESTLDTLGVPYTGETIDRFRAYMDAVLEWNEKINLTAVTDRREFVRRHFADSVLPAALPELAEAGSVADVGTGAGFPGIPLALIFPEKEFLLMDSLGKRINVLEDVKESLNIDNIRLLHARAEDAARDPELRECFDACVSRAVADLAVLAEYCLPFVKTGGSFLAYKGADADGEIDGARKAVKILGGGEIRMERPDVPDLGLEHGIVVIAKTGKTPEKYPRRAGIPAKMPIR